MSREEIKQQLKEIVLEILEDDEIEDIGDEDHFIDDLDMDSLQAVSMLIHIEKRMKVKIPESELMKFRDLNAVTDIFLAFQAEQAGQSVAV